MKKLLGLMGFFLMLTGTAQTADQVIDNYIKAIGGKEKVAAVKAVQKKDLMNMQGMDFPMENYQDTSGRMYSTMEMGGQKVILVAFDGKKGFMFDNRSFGYMDIPEDKAEQFKDKAKNIFGAFYEYKKQGNTVKYKGQKEINGKKMEVIEMHLKKPAEGGIQDLIAYFDTDNHLLKGIEINNLGKRILTRINDYKEFDGVKFPIEIVTEVDGVPQMTLKTESVTVNPPAPSKDKFIKPNNSQNK